MGCALGSLSTRSGAPPNSGSINDRHSTFVISRLDAGCKYNQSVHRWFEISTQVVRDKPGYIVYLGLQVFRGVAQLFAAEPAQKAKDAHVHAPPFLTDKDLSFKIFQEQDGDAIRCKQNVLNGQGIIIEPVLFIRAFERVGNLLIDSCSPSGSKSIRRHWTRRVPAKAHHTENELFRRQVLGAREQRG